MSWKQVESTARQLKVHYGFTYAKKRATFKELKLIKPVMFTYPLMPYRVIGHAVVAIRPYLLFLNRKLPVKKELVRSKNPQDMD